MTISTPKRRFLGATRLLQALGTTVLALLVMLSAAGVASAAFRATAPTVAVKASTLTLAPPTGLTMTCRPSFFSAYPVVNYTPTTTVADVTTRPVKNPNQVVSYTLTYRNNGIFNTSDTVTLDASDTSWSGPAHVTGPTWTLSITADYAGWSSTPATTGFKC